MVQPVQLLSEERSSSRLFWSPPSSPCRRSATSPSRTPCVQPLHDVDASPSRRASVMTPEGWPALPSPKSQLHLESPVDFMPLSSPEMLVHALPREQTRPAGTAAVSLPSSCPHVTNRSPYRGAGVLGMFTPSPPGTPVRGPSLGDSDCVPELGRKGAERAASHDGSQHSEKEAQAVPRDPGAISTNDNGFDSAHIQLAIAASLQHTYLPTKHTLPPCARSSRCPLEASPAMHSCGWRCASSSIASPAPGIAA